jgi:hypothetical protein
VQAPQAVGVLAASTLSRLTTVGSVSDVRTDVDPVSRAKILTAADEKLMRGRSM